MRSKRKSQITEEVSLRVPLRFATPKGCALRVTLRSVSYVLRIALYCKSQITEEVLLRVPLRCATSEDRALSTKSHSQVRLLRITLYLRVTLSTQDRARLIRIAL